MKQRRIIILIAILVICLGFGYGLAKTQKDNTNGLVIPWGWVGMQGIIPPYYPTAYAPYGQRVVTKTTQALGFPFAWQIPCPDTSNPNFHMQIPTGCWDGYNALAFWSNVLIVPLIVLILYLVIYKLKQNKNQDYKNPA